MNLINAYMIAATWLQGDQDSTLEQLHQTAASISGKLASEKACGKKIDRVVGVPYRWFESEKLVRLQLGDWVFATVWESVGGWAGVTHTGPVSGDSLEEVQEECLAKLVLYLQEEGPQQARILADWAK